MIEKDISTKFIFGQKHNGIDCVLYPTAKRACDLALFTEEKICEWSRMSVTTLWRRLEELEKVSRVCIFSDVIEYKIPTNNGGCQYVRLYNLNVLNQLAMVCIDNEELNDISCKFYDILSEAGATDSYSVNQQQAQPMRTLPHDYESALEALLTEVRKNKALQEELDETKAQLAEERKYYDMLSDAVDEFVSTSPLGNGKKVASDLGTDGAKSKESEEAYMTARDWCLKHNLPVSTNEPERTVSNCLAEICMAYQDGEQ